MSTEGTEDTGATPGVGHSSEGAIVVGNAIEPVGNVAPAGGARESQPKEASQVTSLLDAALADQSLSMATRGHLTEARRIIDDVVDGRTVSREPSARKQASRKSAAKKTATKKRSAAKKPAAKRR